MQKTAFKPLGGYPETMKSWGRFLTILLIAILAGSNVPASAVPNAITGKVVNDLNKPIANTSVILSRGGFDIATVKTSAAGAYAFNVDPGAYSIKFVPPTAANGTLNAYDIVAPQTKAMTVQLTTPMPGRAFLSGNLTTSPAMKLAADSTVYFGECCAKQVDSLGNYRLLPTAGTKDLFRIKAASLGTFSFSLYAQEKLAVNQDTIANFVVPVAQQRVRVVDASGAPIAGARVEAGQGLYGTDFAPMGTLEGLGSYNAGWKNKGVTDVNGYFSFQTVKMSPNATAGYLVTPPATNRFLPQQFTKLTGAGDIILTMTNPVSLMSGTVRDQNGVGVGPVDVGFGDVWATTTTQGVYSKPLVDGTRGNYSLTYRSGSTATGTTGTYVSITPEIGAAKLTSAGGLAQDFVLKLDTVKVKVVDSNGVPVAKAHVQLSDNDGYALRGKYTLIPGFPASTATMNSNAPTDVNGFATLKTLRLDSALSGVVTVTPAIGSLLSWKMERVSIGTGQAITVVLSRPTVTVSGKVTLSDGTPAAPYKISFSDGKGGDQGTGTVDPVTGNYIMQVPVGMKGSFYLTCPSDLPVGTEVPFCMSFVGGSRTINAGSVVDIIIPTEKTAIHVVDPNGNGLANVAITINHSVGMGTCTTAKASIFTDFPTIASSAYSVGTTDELGWAMITTIKLSAACEANVNLTPDSNSRYQSRYLALNISDGATNTFVLTIPSPVISSAVVGISSANGSRVITVLGDNFLGTNSVTWNGQEISVFKVDSTSQIRIQLPTEALDIGTVIVDNGGGSSSYTIH